MALHNFEKSSFLASCSYDKEKQELTVTFQNGKEYKYANVPPEAYDGFVNAESAGIYFSTYIRNNYQPPKEEDETE